MQFAKAVWDYNKRPHWSANMPENQADKILTMQTKDLYQIASKHAAFIRSQPRETMDMYEDQLFDRAKMFPEPYRREAISGIAIIVG